ncbi:MAG: hypothetical protein EOO59_11325, partial [Hymenobacter sp.]
MQLSAVLLAATLLLACSAPSAETSAVAVATAPAQAAAFSETFEAGHKMGYAPTNEALATGTWLFAETLIGNSPQDHKDGEHAARMRANGRLTMQFDAPAGVRRIS